MEEKPEKLLEEITFFKEKKQEWLSHYESKFALIKGKDLINTFTTMDEAYKAGVDRFGSQAFLIKQIVKDEPIEEIPALQLGLINARL